MALRVSDFFFCSVATQFLRREFRNEIKEILEN